MMNVKLLRKVAKHISEEPRRYDQDSTLSIVDPEELDDLGNDAPPCGTIGCIGGWVCALTGKTERLRKRFTYERARRELRITPREADRLFAYTWASIGWPDEFRAKYSEAATPAERVAVAVARIEHFIKTKGAE